MNSSPEFPEEEYGSVGADLFPEGGEMAALMRAMDWSSTPLGPPTNWPQSLKTTVRILLTSRFAMWMAWGPELTFFYNDAYRRDTLGKKHPRALGKPTREVWAEIWKDIGPRIATVLQSGTATWDEALLLFLERSGYPEETYHTFSYSPLADDGGAVVGMLCVVTEETERVIGERRLASLRDIGGELAATRTEDEVLTVLARTLDANRKDLPFTLTYFFEEDGARARLAGCTGIEAGQSAAPLEIETAAPGAAWPAAEILEGSPSVTADALSERFGPLPTGAWDRPPHRAAVYPIAQRGQDRPAGFLVAGLNPYRPFDADYAGFVSLVAGQLASSLANARAYEEERRRAEALVELDRAKTAFFSNVSHEFRTPLTLLLGPVEDGLADAEHPLQPEQLKRQEVVHRNGLRLLKLVNSLLDFSRIEAGRVQAVYEPTDLATHTAELASTFRSAVEKMGLRLVVDTPPLPEPVYVDREMWEKIVLNLLSNAFKYTLEGEIAVSLRPVDHGVELEVGDTGVGIPPEELPHVFARFHRVEGARSRTQEGSGIGLALVQELVKLHGGEVSVESNHGEGSTFRVRIPTGTVHLPRERIGARRELASTSVGATPYVQEALGWLPDAHGLEDGEQPTIPAGEGPMPPLPAEAHRGARILLADDNADMRDYVARLLRQQRYRVEAVANGVAALKAARRERPDLVLSDVMMPEMDGFALLEALRDDPGTREIPILLLSARAGEEARIEGMQSGADDYLVKPFSARELLARVGAHLELGRVRREAERQERLHGAILSNTPDLVYIFDLSRRFTFANDALLRMWGRTLAESTGKSLLEIGYEPWHAEMHEREIDQVISTKQPVRGEVAFPHATLGRRVYDYIFAPVLDTEGDVEAIAGATRDITERKEVEDALYRSEQRARLAIETARLGTWSYDLDTGIVHVDERMRAIWGEPGDAVAIPLPTIIERIHPGDRTSVTGAITDALDPSSPGRYAIDYRIVWNDGTTRWLSASGQARFEGEGAERRPVEFLGTALDITERKQVERERERLLAETETARAEAETAEARLREIFRKAPAFIATLRGPNHVYESANPLYLRFVGRDASILGKTVAEEFPEVVEQGLIDLLDQVYRTGEPIVASELPLFFDRRGDGTREDVFLNFVFQPLSEVDGSVSGIFVHAVDVTDQVHARQQVEQQATELEELQAETETMNEELQQTNEELAERTREAEEANRAKSTFLANMSHELRTPINAIVGYAELTEMGIAGPLTEAQRTNLERIRSSSQHLLGLINEVLDLAKVESGQMQVARDRVAAARTVREALELIRPQASQRGVEIRDETTAEARLVYCGDADRVRQILVNLLSNAIKFTEPGGWVAVACRVEEHPDAAAQLPKDGPWLRIDVEDDGAGIPPEHLGQIFEPFFQVDGGFTRESGGTGLGLTISRRLTRMMGGDLTVRSRLGEGSCFTLWLPAALEGVGGEGEGRRVWPHTPREMPRLAEVGRTLARYAENIVQEMADRLREDGITPGAKELDRAQLENHTATFLLDIGLALAALSEGGGESALMRDGTEIQRVISERHGAQRARLGWPEEALRREFGLLREIVERTLRRHVPREAEGDVDEAMAVLLRLMEQAERISLRGFRGAIESDSRGGDE